MKPSGVEWIGDIPAHWEVKRVKDCAEENTSQLQTIPENIKYIDISSVSYNEGIHTVQFLTKSDIPSRARKTPKKDDIIISNVRTYLKAIAKVQQDDLVVSTGFTVFRSNKNTDHNFLYYCLQSDDFMSRVNLSSKGISYPAITGYTLKNLLVVQPPIKEQSAIASFLDDRTSAIDSKISALEEKEQSLAELRKSIIHEAVTKGLDPKVPMKASGVDWIGDIPAHWEVTRGKNFLKYSKKINKDGIKTKIWSLTLNGVLENDPSNPIGLVPNDYASYQFFETNDLVFKLIDLENTRTSRIGVVPSPGIMSPAYIRMSVKKGVVQYQHWMFKDMWYRNIFNMLGGSGVRSNLTAANLYELVLVQPPLAEQQAIAAYLDERTAVIDQSIDTVKQEVQALQELRKSLIHEAVTGKINVADFGYNY